MDVFGQGGGIGGAITVEGSVGGVGEIDVYHFGMKLGGDEETEYQSTWE